MGAEYYAARIDGMAALSHLTVGDAEGDQGKRAWPSRTDATAGAGLSRHSIPYRTRLRSLDR